MHVYRASWPAFALQAVKEVAIVYLPKEVICYNIN